MEPDVVKPVIPGLVFCFLAVVFGTGAGMAFGLVEDEIKTLLRKNVEAHPEVHAQTPENLEKQTADAWRYVNRAHFHAQGLGALGVGITLTLALTGVSRRVKSSLSLAVGLGAFLYPLCWLIAGLRIPSIGKHAAKASVDWLAGVSVPLFFGGMGLVLLVLVLSWLSPSALAPVRETTTDGARD